MRRASTPAAGGTGSTEGPDGGHACHGFARSAIAEPGLILLLALTALYLAVLGLRAPALLGDLSWNSDAVSPAVLTEARGGSGGPVVLGDISSATTLAFDRLTAPLPAHRLIWSAMPYVLTLLGAALLGWTASRVGGARAALVAVVIVIAASPAVLLTQFAPAFHGTTWMTTCLLATLLVSVPEGARRAPARFALVTACVSVIAGANLASDPLLGPAGLIPLAAAPLLVRGTSTRVRALAGAGAAGAVVVALALTGLMQLAGVESRRGMDAQGGLLAVATPAEAIRRLAELPGLTANLAGLGGAGLVVLGLGVAAVMAGRRRRDGTSGRPRLRRLYAAYWLTSGGAVLGAYALSAAVGEVGAAGQRARYLVPLLYALAALTAVWASDHRRLRLAVPVVAVYALANLVALSSTGFSGLVQEGRLPTEAGALTRWLRSQDASRGYAGYWDANVLRYRTRLQVSAVVQCHPDGERGLCPDRLNGERGWFTPGPGRTFVLVDPTPGGAHVVSTLPPAARFGRPVAGRRFGPISAWIYRDDIGRHLTGPWAVNHPSGGSGPRRTDGPLAHAPL